MKDLSQKPDQIMFDRAFSYSDVSGLPLNTRYSTQNQIMKYSSTDINYILLLINLMDWIIRVIGT